MNTIRVPKDIDAVKLIKFAMDKFSLEISAGMLQTVCRCWHNHDIANAANNLASLNELGCGSR